MRAVVARGNAQLHPKLHTSALLQLIGMNAGAQPRGRTALQYCAGLVHVERAAVAKHVDPFGMALASLKHLALNQRHIVVGIGVGRNNVSAQECCFRRCGFRSNKGASLIAN